jgi:chromosome segregation ATPase
MHSRKLLSAALAGAVVLLAQGAGAEPRAPVTPVGAAPGASEVNALVSQIESTLAEVKSLADELASLLKNKPVQPAAGASAEESAAYKAALSAWTKQVAALEAKLVKTEKKLSDQQRALEKLQAELAAKRRKSSELESARTKVIAARAKVALSLQTLRAARKPPPKN